ncbi:MAG: citrate synthase/methylcitrate synthase [Aigarchaeota archaeon]|nr:citrate synthase/methylcitrate synthase [Aigarchaeota archaeon]MDW8092863.1 citrate synthase/methylcitrate synthase [Nitrososphaerota archaeon]
MKSSEVKKGLEGVYVTESALSYIDVENSKLYYVGYDIEDLVKYSSYEEVCYLLLHQRLPRRGELDEFVSKFADNRVLDDKVLETLKFVARGKDVINTLASHILLSYQGETGEAAIDPVRARAHGIRIISQMAILVANISRIRRGLDPIIPDRSMSHAASFLYIMRGEMPDAVESSIIDDILIMHAEHGIPASTFGALVTASTLSDLYSAIVSGLLTLKGPLHGGAAEATYRQLLEIGTPENVDKWLTKALESKRKIMGFGHRVYRNYDPRAVIVKEIAIEVAKRKGGRVKELLDISLLLEKEGVRRLGERGIYPNVDFWTPVVYAALDVPVDVLTAFFASSRVVGWVAHILDYWRDNRLIRPLHKYVGELGRPYIPLEGRY